MSKDTHSPLNLSSTQSKDIKVSYFKNAKSTKKTKDIFISDYLELVSDPARKEAAEKLRELPADEYKKVKPLQPCITGSCVTDADGRSLKNILFLNGLACVDFDELPKGYNDWQEFKEHLQNDPFTFIVHYSLSGKGLALFVKIPIENNFIEIYLSLAEYYDLMFGAKIDFLADENRPRFIAFDPKPFHNPNSEVYTDTLQQEHKAEPTQQQDNDNILDSFSTDPAIAFNNSGLAGLEIVNEILTDLDYTITAGKKPTIFDYQRTDGSPKSIVCFYNRDIVKFQVFSSNTGLKKEHYNLYEIYKELKNLDHYTAQKELAKLGFGEWNEPQLIATNSKESYSSTIDFLEPKNLRLNQLTGFVEIAGSPLNDTHTAQLITELSLRSGKNQSREILQTCIDVISNKNQFHPFMEMIEELKKLPATNFSELHELDILSDCFISSTPKELRLIYLSRWMLGLFDLHILQRMTKNVLILSGSQNSGKTSFAKNALPEPLKQYGKVVEFNPNKMVDAKVNLCSTLIAIFDEFEDILTKSKSLSDFKNLTSSYDILERRPFRRNPEQMYRSSIIMATTNEQNILNDSTGNTRFLTIDVQGFDFKKYHTIDLNKVWRVIYDLHKAGETSVLNDSERELQVAGNINFESEDFVCGLIEKSFYLDDGGFITTTDILIEIDKATKQNISIKRIGQALRKIGAERKSKRVASVPKYGYALKYKFEA